MAKFTHVRFERDRRTTIISQREYHADGRFCIQRPSGDRRVDAICLNFARRIGDGQAHRMSRAVDKLREHFDQPLRIGIGRLAKELGMSPSGFHAHFKTVTAMSPLQFQKQLRFQEARRLMLSENLDAAQAGYPRRLRRPIPFHISRAYKGHFGELAARDVERLRELADSR